MAAFPEPKEALMLKKWAHVILAALLHLSILFGVHEIATRAIEAWRDELLLAVYDEARALAFK
jgi:hypothetical protein